MSKTVVTLRVTEDATFAACVCDYQPELGGRESTVSVAQAGGWIVSLKPDLLDDLASIRQRTGMDRQAEEDGVPETSAPHMVISLTILSLFDSRS